MGLALSISNVINGVYMNRDWLEDGFRESLNHQYGSFIVAGYTLKAADILKECNRFCYDILFIDYMQEMRGE